MKKTPHDPNKQILIYGAYGYNNFGDDLFFHLLSNLFKKENLTFISGNTKPPQDLLDEYPRNRFIYSKDFKNLIKEITQSKALILGPGSIFVNEMKRLHYNLYIIGLVTLARILRKPVYFWGIDIIKTKNILFRMTMGMALICARKIFLRFKDNEDRIKCSLIRNKVITMHDPVLSSIIPCMKDRLSPVKKIIDKIRKKEKRELLFIISDLKHISNYSQIEEFYFKMFQTLKEQKIKFDFLFLNNSYGSNANKDQAYYFYLRNQKPELFKSAKTYAYTSWDSPTVKKVHKLIDQYEIIASNKLHATIASVLWDADKIISLNYHHKMNYVNNEISLHKELNFNLLELNESSVDKEINRFKDLIIKIKKEKTKSYNKRTVANIVKENNNQLQELKQEINNL